MKNSTNQDLKLGAVAVGVAAGITTLMLAHKPTRKRAKKAIQDALNTGDKKLDELMDRATKTKKDVTQKAKKNLDNV